MIRSNLAILMAALAVGACASAPTIEERPPSGEVAPIERPVLEPGRIREEISMIDGSARGYEVLGVLDDGSIRGRSSWKEGCKWVVPADWFSPDNSWEDCGTGSWSTGANTVISSSGDDLWPLRDGTSAKWSYRSRRSTGEGGRNTRRCKVSGPVAITVRVGDVNAMKVVCRDVWGGGPDGETKTWYWTSEHGVVKYTRVHSKRGLEDDNELVAVR